MLKTFKQMKALYNFLKYLVYNYFSDFKKSFFKNKKKKANSGSHLKFICQLLFKKDACI